MFSAALIMMHKETSFNVKPTKILSVSVEEAYWPDPTSPTGVNILSFRSHEHLFHVFHHGLNILETSFPQCEYHGDVNEIQFYYPESFLATKKRKISMLGTAFTTVSMDNFPYLNSAKGRSFLWGTSSRYVYVNTQLICICFLVHSSIICLVFQCV